jgi:hypothetical protein
MEKEVNSYIGDIISSLIKEAAFYKAKCFDYEKELIELRKKTNQLQEKWTGAEDSQSLQNNKM